MSEGDGNGTRHRIATHRSFSQLNQLRRCSWAYKLSRLDRLPERPSVPAVAGKVIHSASEAVDHAMHEGCSDAGQLGSIGSNHVEKGLSAAVDEHSVQYGPETWKSFGRQDWAWFQDVGIPNSIRAYVDWRLESKLALYEVPGFGPAIEVPFELTLGGVLIRGFIDRIFVGNLGHLLVVDIKSGQKPKTDEQLAVYRAALNVGGIPASWGMYVYALKSGKAESTNVIDLSYWTVDHLTKVYSTADLIIRNELFMPSPGAECFTCSVREHCEFSQSAI